MKINKFSLIILIVIILVATIASNFMIVLVAPISALRTLVLAITLSSCFVLIYFSNLNRLKVSLLCLVFMLTTIAIEHLLPKTFTNELMGGEPITDFWANILSIIRTAGYFSTLFVAMIATGFVRKVIQTKDELTQKFIISACMLFIGIIGGGLFSAVNVLELALFTAMSGMLFSGMLYIAYSVLIIMSPIPDKYLDKDNKDIKE